MIFARRGLSLDNGASWLLPRLVGMARAKELALFGDMLEAGQRPAMGLVNRVVPVAELDAFVDDWAARLAAGPPIALSMTKSLLHNSLSASMARGGRGRGPLPGRATSPPRTRPRPWRPSCEARAPLVTGR